jgi:two-component system, cell cycle response regulator DivK
MKTILIVDNDPDTRTIYTTALRHSGYDVLEAADGATGVRAAQERSPDLIVMNLSMPEMDGISAMNMLRADARTAMTPIIACTGFVKEDGEELAEHAGCDAYLEKPCEPTRLVEEVERFVGPGVVAGGTHEQAPGSAWPPTAGA